MDAPQLLQLGIVETLDAQREARDATGRVVANAAGLGGAGVRLHGDLGIRPYIQTGAQHGQQFVQPCRRQQAGRAATEEHAVHHPSPDQRQGLVQVAQQRVDVGIERQLALGLVRGAVAGGAFAHAPRQVHVQRQRRRHQARRSVVVARAGFAGQVVAVVVGVRHGLHR
ncbi:hypothetical protein G6F24_016171 [Rhizopus arrhizus]|nr:hypothetical protein G6F24_016171 [Rhizopus arrhizus]